VVRELRRLPDWAKLAIAFVTVLALSDERTRAEIVKGLRSAANMVAGFLDQLFGALRAVIEFLAPLIEIPIAAAYVLLKGVVEAIVELRSIST
jgi:hypothetical protein